MPDPEAPSVAAPAPTTTPAPAKSPPVVETVVAAAEAKAKAVDAAFETWLAGLRDSEISRHTPAWNRLTAELGGIKSAILKLF